MPTFPAAFRNLAGEGAIFLRKDRINPAVFRMFSISPWSVFSADCGDFLLFLTVFSLFSGFPFYTYYNKEDFHYEHHYRHRPRLLCYQNSPLLVPGRADKLRRTRTLRLLIFHYLSVSYSTFKRQISDKPQVTVLWKCIRLQYIAQNGKKTPCIWYWNQIRGCCDILLFILPAAVSRLHRNGSSALIPPAGRILSRPSPQSTHGWTRYAHGCKIYLVQMKSNIQCDFECDFLLYLRTLPFNLTV